ncbi:MAG TPA: hypothetical protein VHN15_06700 [Thermoanaerobaculia bacterium]|nr:hypothetical protein [Thermoanaerobaculia bacterium]
MQRHGCAGRLSTLRDRSPRKLRAARRNRPYAFARAVRVSSRLVRK